VEAGHPSSTNRGPHLLEQARYILVIKRLDESLIGGGQGALKADDHRNLPSQGLEIAVLSAPLNIKQRRRRKSGIGDGRSHDIPVGGEWPLL
jgi:hypothetical protein